MWVKRTWQWTPFPHHIKRRNKIFNGILWIRPLMRGYRAKYAESFWTFPLVNKKKTYSFNCSFHRVRWIFQTRQIKYLIRAVSLRKATKGCRDKTKSSWTSAPCIFDSFHKRITYARTTLTLRCRRLFGFDTLVREIAIFHLPA